MTSLEIINKALRRIGAAPASSLSDTNRNPVMAIEEYEEARDEVLRMFPWPCAIKRAAPFSTAHLVCAWIASHAYHVDDRVTNDTGKVYVCVIAGTSHTSGGPTGTTAGITDGTVTWNYEAANDATTNWAWKASTAYVVDDVVGNYDNRIYVCITLGTSHTSGGPTTTAADITDGTVHWEYICTLPANETIYAEQYLYPRDCLKILRVGSDVDSEERGPGDQYLLEGQFIYTNLSDTKLKYIERLTNPTTWDRLLARSVVLRLASLIAYDVTGKTDVSDRMAQEFAQTVGMAKGVAIHEGAEAPDEPVRWEEV